MSDEAWMRQALVEARDAAAAGEVPVGALVVEGERRLAGAGNCVIAANDPTGHAEIRAMRQAALLRGNYRLGGCTLYVTLEPCAMCFGAMLHARIERLVFAAADAKTGALGGVIDLPALYRVNHRIEINSGPCAGESAALLREFFAARR